MDLMQWAFKSSLSGNREAPAISAHPTPLDDLEKDHHHGEDQQDMNEAAQCVGADKSKCPKDKENNGDRVEHDVCWLRVMCW